MARNATIAHDAIAIPACRVFPILPILPVLPFLPIPPRAYTVTRRGRVPRLQKGGMAAAADPDVAYVFNYLDRNNIGFAALTMNREIGLTATAFGRGAGMLFVGYCFLEVPSNMVLYRVGARKWLARIMITWGLVSAATIFVTGAWSFYLLRFLLGAAEAGFFPGVAFYISHWFPADYRTRVVAWFMVAIPISSVVGGVLSGALLQMNGILGLAGWKWLFILEGLPVTVLGLVVLRVLTERPEDATWLTDAERARHSCPRRRRGRDTTKSAGCCPRSADVRVLILAAVQFGFLVGSYGVGIWLPQIVKQGQLSNFEVGLVTSGVYAFASIAMILWANHVDRGGNKVAEPGARVSRVGHRPCRRDCRDELLGVGGVADRVAGRHQRRSRHLLYDSHAVSDGHRAGGRAGVRQLDWHRRRLRRAADHGMARGSDGIVLSRARRAGRVSVRLGGRGVVAEIFRQARLTDDRLSSSPTMAKEYLGNLELMVLLSLIRVGDQAYGVPISREIERRTGRDVALGSVYAALDRLERKGFVSSVLGDPTPERGGRAKRYFQITAKGVREVRDAQRMLTNMWRNLSVLQGELA